MKVFRTDTTRLDKVERTPGGGVRIPAVLTRSGVFEYQQPDGKVIREYRPPDEVARADSVATLRDAPVTVGHPAGLVTPDTWRRASVGHVSGEPKNENGGVAATVVVNDAAAIQAIDAGELKEISSGYTVEMDLISGVTAEGQRYDRIQRNIQYNHVALGPSGWGRQGASVGLRLDDAGNELTENTPVANGVYLQPMAEKPCPKCSLRSDEDYPWDDCMRDQLAKYGDEETARKVCAAIKNGTVNR